MKDNKTKLTDEQRAANFTKWKTTINSMYDLDLAYRAAGRTQAAYSSASLNDPELIRQKLERGSVSHKELSLMSRTLYATDATYASFIDYLTSIFYFRYVTIPQKIKTTGNKKSYEEIYNSMVGIVDGINIPVTYKNILNRIFVEGVVYLYASINKKSNTMETTILPSEYCKLGPLTQFGTYQIQFDLTYVRDLEKTIMSTSNGNSGMIMTWEEVFTSLPKEWQEGYINYIENGGPKFILLNGKHSAAIPANEFLFPPKLMMITSRNDYLKIKENELEQSNNQLTDILVHEVPMHDGELVLELDEIKVFHSNLTKSFKTEKNLKVVTSFGKMEMLHRSRTNAAENAAIEHAYQALYFDAGMNYNVFNGISDEALKNTFTRDEAFVRQFIDQITTFFKLSLNHYYNFTPYQLEFDILQITSYNYDSKVESYKDAATLGINKLQYMVASGMKQSLINSQLELEEFLNLDALRPLQSSHTTSGAALIEEEHKENDKESNTEESDTKEGSEETKE